MSDHEQYMRFALEEAQACGDDVPVGCVIVHDGKVLVRSQNQRERTQDPCGHSEILALREAAAKLGRWRLHDCTLYCTLEPCPMCAEAILQARISEVVFGAYDKQYGAMGSAFNLYVHGRPFPLPPVTGGVLEQECSTLIKDFFKRRRAEAEAAQS
jgi:tRNA(adenine34) deaminase